MINFIAIITIRPVIDIKKVIEVKKKLNVMNHKCRDTTNTKNVMFR